MEYTYREVLKKIESARRFGSQPGVEVTARMLEVLGEPQRGLPFVHVAGTNGKGSVCAFLDAILQELGLKVGRFTSPHLVDFRERITVNSAMIDEEAVARLGNRLLSMDFGVPPTMFDYCLLMAVLYFKEQGCDIAVIETGLGGRLDSTNALGKPEAAVITHIGYDHMEVLGDTLTAIAGEKAGILKDGVPAVFAPQEPEVMAVLGAWGGDSRTVTSDQIERARAYAPGLSGEYQLENAAVAAETIRVLAPGLPASPETVERAIARGIHGASWPGRMEVLSEHPHFLVDGAHNKDGVLALKRSLEALYPGEKFHFVMAVMRDKDYKGMVEILLPLAEDVFTVTLEDGRAMQGEELAAYIRSRNVPARTVESTREVFALPVEGERTVAFGSLYFIGALLADWQDITDGAQ